MIYLVGSLKNPEIPKIANRLREATSLEVFDNWYSPGPEADDFTRDYCRGKGLTYPEAMKDHAVQHVFEFDKKHIDRAETVIMVMPAGKSGHLELGYALGRGKKGYILFNEEPERFDVMHNFATGIFMNIDDLVAELIKPTEPFKPVLIPCQRCEYHIYPDSINCCWCGASNDSR